MRLIDADALEKDLSKLWEEMDDVDYGEYVRDANKMLNHYPTIEAVPVKPLAKTVMSPTEFLEALKEIDKAAKRPGRQYDDYELFHTSADDLMCEILRSLGYSEGVDFFEAHEKWYA